MPDNLRKPSAVNAFEGFVVMDGPQAASITFCPDAAEETGRRLIEQAKLARAFVGPTLHVSFCGQDLF